VFEIWAACWLVFLNDFPYDFTIRVYFVFSVPCQNAFLTTLFICTQDSAPPSTTTKMTPTTMRSVAIVMEPEDYLWGEENWCCATKTKGGWARVGSTGVVTELYIDWRNSYEETHEWVGGYEDQYRKEAKPLWIYWLPSPWIHREVYETCISWNPLVKQAF